MRRAEEQNAGSSAIHRPHEGSRPLWRGCETGDEVCRIRYISLPPHGHWYRKQLRGSAPRPPVAINGNVADQPRETLGALGEILLHHGIYQLLRHPNGRWEAESIYQSHVSPRLWEAVPLAGSNRAADWLRYHEQRWQETDT